MRWLLWMVEGEGGGGCVVCGEGKEYDGRSGKL
jgi:hypothetical protein